MNNIGLYSPSMQMGKTTVAKYLISKYGYETVILARTLKRMLEVFLQDLGYTSHYAQEMIYGTRKEIVIPELGVTPRHLMQTLGTEWARTYVHPDVWIKICTANLIKNQPYVSEDIRFLNEGEAFREAGFKIVKIINPRVPIIRNHASEGELDNYSFDYVIINDGTIEDLYKKIDILLEIMVNEK